MGNNSKRTLLVILLISFLFSCNEYSAFNNNLEPAEPDPRFITDFASISDSDGKVKFSWKMKRELFL